MTAPAVAARPRQRARRAIRRARVLWPLLVVALILGGAPAYAETVEEYRAVVAHAADALAAVAEADSAVQARALADVERELGAVDRIELPDGQTLGLADPGLHAALASHDLSGVRQQLAALLDGLDRAQASSSAPPDAAARLAAILARPEFRVPEPSVWDRLVQPLRDLWERLWRQVAYWLAARGRGDGNPAWIALAVLVVLGVGAVLVGAFGGNVVASARVAPPAPGRRVTARETRARAEALAAAGEYRAAVHELYLATLQLLDERRLLRFRPALTNREHLRRGQVAPALLGPLATLVEGYDQAWYSGEACTAADWQRFRALADAVAAAGARPTREAP